jgi:Zn-dependent protease with chaperone function
VVAELDVPGAAIGYESGRPVVAVDPLLPRIVGPAGMRAVFAHELGHLRVDLHTDAVRAYLPQTVGFGVVWTLFLAGRGPAVATVGTAAFLAVAPVRDRRVVAVRCLLSLGAEAAALAASRYANRMEEYRADAYAAELLSPAAVVETLVRVAAVARGDNVEDVAGPVPWRADRPRLFALFATHPTVEDRVAAISGSVPDWAARGPERGAGEAAGPGPG